MKNLTREEIANLEQHGSPMPPYFTGVWKETRYYLGKPWLGPSNLMGHGPLKDVEGGVARR